MYSLLALLFFVGVQNTYSQDISINHKAFLNVNAAEIIEGQLYSYISRELRSIEDIKIESQENADFNISVLVLEANDRSNYTQGYTCSLVVTEHVGSETIRNTYMYVTSPENESEAYEKFDSSLIGKIVNKMLGKSTVIIRHHTLLIDSDLKDLASRIVSEVDFNVFEENRKQYRDILDNN